jgi:hypothetical protein
MQSRRHASRVTAWIALAAILLSTFTPATAHGHGLVAGFDGHADFCSTTTGTNVPAPPLPPARDREVCTHCDGCTASTGNAWAPPSSAPGAIALRATPPAILVTEPPIPAPADLIAAPPRGPPLPV